MRDDGNCVQVVLTPRESAQLVNTDVRTLPVGEGQAMLDDLARNGARRMIAAPHEQYDRDAPPSAAAAFLSATRQHLSNVVPHVAPGGLVHGSCLSVRGRTIRRGARKDNGWSRFVVLCIFATTAIGGRYLCS